METSMKLYRLSPIICIPRYMTSVCGKRMRVYTVSGVVRWIPQPWAMMDRKAGGVAGINELHFARFPRVRAEGKKIL